MRIKISEVVNAAQPLKIDVFVVVVQVELPSAEVKRHRDMADFMLPPQRSWRNAPLPPLLFKSTCVGYSVGREMW